MTPFRKLVCWALLMVALAVSAHQVALYAKAAPREAAVTVIVVVFIFTMTTILTAAFDLIVLSTMNTTVALALAAMTAPLVAFMEPLAIVGVILLLGYAYVVARNLKVAYWQALAVLVAETAAITVAIAMALWWIAPVGLTIAGLAFAVSPQTGRGVSR